MAQKKYHDELEVQANERRRIRELEKLKQKQEEVLVRLRGISFIL